MIDISVVWLGMALAGLTLLACTVVQTIRRREELGWKERGCNLGCLGLILLFAPFVCGPIFDGAREKSRVASCLSNLKQLALGLLMYAADYEDHLPPANRWCDAVEP